MRNRNQRINSNSESRNKINFTSLITMAYIYLLVLRSGNAAIRIKVDKAIGITLEVFKSTLAMKMGINVAELSDFGELRYIVDNDYMLLADDDDMRDCVDEIRKIRLWTRDDTFESLHPDGFVDNHQRQLAQPVQPNVANIQVHQNDDSRHISSTLAKLSLSSIPHVFKGEEKENIFHFKSKLEKYAVQNNISEEHLERMMINGLVLKGKAFTYLQNTTEPIDPDNVLKSYWKILIKKFKQLNRVTKYRLELNQLRQNNLGLKEYIDLFKEKVELLRLEIKVQNENGAVYKQLNDHEMVEICMQNMNKQLQAEVSGKIIEKYQSPYINMQQFDEVAEYFIQKEQLVNQLRSRGNNIGIKSNDNRFKKERINTLNNNNERLRRFDRNNQANQAKSTNILSLMTQSWLSTVVPL